MEVFWAWSNGKRQGQGQGQGTAVAHGGQRSSRYGARYGAATAAVQGTRCIEVR